ncbi:MAG: hemolysin III family protein [Waddliaceae bacterium]|jgi:hemolysin III|nr:hemolysin III family protein [Waddliaceae bacterium]MBT3578369.1 hemolysin III family protein [Waddliaceae bacterium]MBT4445556.1 hemolysin III family protein [Waddliaceae bacterium]MBT6929104.1 hemolysin III family protein [Waddliaceae bacterium]MBT7264408.1 hemolysin III family protein [Waddliaceae bacterium]
MPPQKTSSLYGQSLVEELFNSLTHGFGLILSVIGLPLLITIASLYGTAMHIVSCSIYATTLVILYASSTCYHHSRSPRRKRFFHIMDHISIYLLIAGSYTPFALVTLRGPWGWSLFGVVWGIALTGTIIKIFFTGRFDLLSTLLYLAMGWIVVIAVVPLVRNLAPSGLAYLIAGGLAYSLGVIFYLWEKLPFSHAVWHLFVLAGSVFHYYAIMFYVVPLSH